MGEMDMLGGREILTAIAAATNGIIGADRLAGKLGYKPARHGRMAVSAKLRKLMRMGLVARIAPEDRWDHADYCLTNAGRAALSPIPTPPETPT